MQATSGAIFVDYREPHLDRTRKILAAHPEARKLVGSNATSIFYLLGIVALQIGIAIALRNSPIWLIFVAAYVVGAVANHALWVLIHESTHNLIFKKTVPSCIAQIIANLPIIFPSAMSFRIYHLKHHLYQGDLDRDADLARPFEARLVGCSTVRKTIWFLLFFVSQTIRVPFVKGVRFFNGWVLLNNVVEIGFLIALTSMFGWKAFLYLAIASIFSVGLHPVGGRWIQEHYIVSAPQETYSYYGPFNRVAFNVGYHNEHHDMMGIPWNRLPELRAMAPEFYDTLVFHTSWSKLLFRFLTDPKLGPGSRIYRKSPSAANAGKATTTVSSATLAADSPDFAYAPEPENA